MGGPRAQGRAEFAGLADVGAGQCQARCYLLLDRSRCALAPPMVSPTVVCAYPVPVAVAAVTVSTFAPDPAGIVAANDPSAVAVALTRSCRNSV